MSYIVALIVICALIIVLLALQKKKDHFDPSIRVSGGWLAGPQWGAQPGDDPVSEFARQIAEQQEYERQFYRSHHI